jgi:signal transduction histidine kinase
MSWIAVRRSLGRNRDLVLAAAFTGLAAWELLEMWAFERHDGSPLSLRLLVHSLQVALIMGATWVVLGAWRDKTRHAEELAGMVEKVVFAQEEERRRIAYDLHDGIAQLIVSAKQHADTCAELLRSEPGRAARELTTAVDRLQQSIVETRRVLAALRPSAIESAGLATAIRRSLEDTAREAGWSVSLVENLGNVRLPPAVETAAFRILQEALANARKHGRTARVEVDVSREAEWLTLEIRDHGVGFASANELTRGRGLGLVSMRERARLLGGACTVDSVPEQGTRVQARLPLDYGGSYNHRP